MCASRSLPDFPAMIENGVEQPRHLRHGGQAAMESQTLSSEGGIRIMTHQESGPTATPFPDQDGKRHVEILGQLTQIQNSHAFCNSARSKEFLSYVVEQTLAGRTDILKERSIGVDLFHRAPTYDTSEDPIVRVKAGEVRRRLAEFYAGEEPAPELQIEIPVGSYIPKFHWRSPADALAPTDEPPAVEQIAPRPKLRTWKTAVATTVLVILVIAAAITVRKNADQKSSFDEFWAPVSTTGQPVLICVSSPVGYALGSNPYAKASQTHPGVYDSPTKRSITPLQLDPDTPLEWKDVIPLVDFYVNKDDVYVATELSELFARIHKSSQTRIGNDFNYEDLRNSPAVIIGAFDNPWTVRIMSDSPIVFREEGNDQWIEERVKPNRAWRPGVDGRRGSKDFAIVARLQSSKTGQFLVIVGGVGMVGTEAAGRFVTRQTDLDAALRNAPAGWQAKNLEMVLESDVIDGSASTPQVVAVRSW